MADFLTALRVWSVCLTDAETRLRVVAMVGELVKIAHQVVVAKRYGKFGVTFTAEAGKIVQWHEMTEASNK